ncbi:hypothetical protein VaNZ11_012728 [Volvox africanus]|uniref:Uncharacterized protein n=1 Tax=Volvox africanus TaxID=51714 RepID=A0ABQ5SG72_9CHLO|nr:hypothetical protein VaNZ11_012728 [Volvox africanus]
MGENGGLVGGGAFSLTGNEGRNKPGEEAGWVDSTAGLGCGGSVALGRGSGFCWLGNHGEEVVSEICTGEGSGGESGGGGGGGGGDNSGNGGRLGGAGKAVCPGGCWDSGAAGGRNKLGAENDGGGEEWGPGRTTGGGAGELVSCGRDGKGVTGGGSGGGSGGAGGSANGTKGGRILGGDGTVETGAVGGQADGGSGDGGIG